MLPESTLYLGWDITFRIGGVFNTRPAGETRPGSHRHHADKSHYRQGRDSTPSFKTPENSNTITKEVGKSLPFSTRTRGSSESITTPPGPHGSWGKHPEVRSGDSKTQEFPWTSAEGFPVSPTGREVKSVIIKIRNSTPSFNTSVNLSAITKEVRKVLPFSPRSWDQATHLNLIKIHGYLPAPARALGMPGRTQTTRRLPWTRRKSSESVGYRNRGRSERTVTSSVRPEPYKVLRVTSCSSLGPMSPPWTSEGHIHS